MACLSLVWIALAASAGAATVQISWTTDVGACNVGDQDCGLLGPDGPWQAVLATLGNGSNTTVALYPSSSSSNTILMASAGGSFNLSGKATPVQGENSTVNGVEDYWMSTKFVSETVRGLKYTNSLSIGQEKETFTVSTTTNVASKWTIDLENGSFYVPTVGTLGLTPPGDPSNPNQDSPGIIEQLKTMGRSSSVSFGLQIGSAWMNLSGSLILGGYDQSRALGDVAVFQLDGVGGLPNAALVDVTLGVETGGSPFNESLGITKNITKSLWQDENKSVNISFNPVSPSMYLPPGQCETIAKQLPVTWRDDIGYYVWNEADPQYRRIVTSPAYLGFAIADNTSKTVTVKVPFALLNLTLQAPIVNTPTRYFPCRPPPVGSSNNFWQLGRAFLQAAFLGVNYETNVMYLAQAPGPKAAQPKMRIIGSRDRSIQTNPIVSLDESWGPYWTALPESDDAAKGGLSAGTIAGIVPTNGA